MQKVISQFAAKRGLGYPRDRRFQMSQVKPDRFSANRETMESSHEYLEKTKSAALSLLTGIDGYLNALGSAPNPGLVGCHIEHQGRFVRCEPGIDQCFLGP
jgi:hypothetical protein